MKSSIDYAIHLRKWRYILILTADLPYLNKESFLELINFLSDEMITIIPAPEKNGQKGTSGLFFSLSKWLKISLLFGNNSCNRFIEEFLSKNLSYNLYNNILGFDLDDKDDLTSYLNSNTEKSFVSEINKVLTQI